MNVGPRFIAGSVVSQFGNWMSVTAVMVYLQVEAGAAAVSLYFLLRTLLPYFLARFLVRTGSSRSLGAWWASSQLILAMLSVAIAIFGHDVSIILALTAIASIFQAASNPSVMAMIGILVPDEHKGRVITSVSTSTSLALVAGPAVGGLLTAVGGLPLVFAIDAATYLIAIALVPWRGCRESSSDGAHPGTARWRVLLSFFVAPAAISRVRTIKRLVAIWIIFAILGGVLNALELPVFDQIQQLSAQEIGFVIAAFGVGGLVVFIAATFFRYAPRSLAVSLVMGAGLITWLLVDGWLIYPAFFIAGVGYSLFNSSMRARFQEAFDAARVTASDCWAWLFQINMLVSLLVFGISTIYFAAVDELLWPILLLTALTIVLGFVCSLPGSRREIATTENATDEVDVSRRSTRPHTAP